MRILFDQGTPGPLEEHVAEHQIETAFELGRSRLTNGELLAVGEGRFDVLPTTDRNLRNRQSPSGRKLAILVLPTTSWPKLRGHVQSIASGLASMKAGDYVELPE